MAHNAMGIDPCDSQNDAIFNTTTDKRNNVQPRTGLFEAYVPLPVIRGNLGLGPEIDLSLFYSPVVNNHAGLGDGWSFAITTYDQGSGRLTLHTGEVLRVEPGDDTKTPAVVARWKDNGSTLEVERKDGRTETLQRQGESTIWVPVFITQDGYRFVSLHWEVRYHAVEGQDRYQILLCRISNVEPADSPQSSIAVSESERTLAELSYNAGEPSDTVVITFWPGTSETLQYILSIEDVALQSVTPPEGAGWESRFTYQDDADCGWLLTSIVTFDGLTETVTYVPETRRFPGNRKLERLPCVSRHTVTPRAGGADVVTDYSYFQNSDGGEKDLWGLSDETSNNDLAEQAHDADISWLYLTRVSEISEASPRSTDYYYDDSHVLVLEITSLGEQGISRSFLDAEYADTRRKGLRTRKVSVAYKRNNEYVTIYPDEVTQSVYEGSALRFHEAKSRGTSFDFEKHGDFPDAYLVLESRCDTAEDAFDPESNRQLIRSTRFEPIEGINRKRPASIRTSLAENGAVARQEISYYTTGYKNGLRKDIYQGIETKSGGVGADGATRITQDYTLKDGELSVVTKQRRGSEELASTIVSSIYSGRRISDTDSAGNCTTYSYDGEGRMTSRRVCQGTEYEEVTTFAYPCNGRMEITEPNGRRHAVESDGRDNVIKDEVFDGAAWSTLFETSFDELGRRCRTTHFDVVDDVPIIDTVAFVYDAWGREHIRAYSDGRKEFDQYDPVNRMRHQWSEEDNDKHGKETYYNDDDSIGSVEFYDDGGRSVLFETYAYRDGRMTRFEAKTHNGSRAIRYEYDTCGRCILEGHFILASAWWEMECAFEMTYSTTDYLDTRPTGIRLLDVRAAVADGALILDGEQFTGVFSALNSEHYGKYVRNIGERSFDAWGRVTSITRAGITERMTYQGMEPVPATVMKADGTRVDYEYIKELGYRPRKIMGQVAEGSKFREYTYTYANQRQSAVKDDQSNLVFEHDSQMRPVTSASGLTDGPMREVKRSWSRAGRLVSETDSRGETTRFSYNSLGQRIRTLRNPDTSTSHVYGVHGDLTSEDISDGKCSSSVSYNYDGSHREIRRTFTLPGGMSLNLCTEYEVTGRVKSLSLSDSSRVIGSKEYTYDLMGRLATCMTTDAWRPKNPKGKPIDSQDFTYDVLGNVIRCVTIFGKERCTTEYTYDDSGFRLIRVRNDHADYRADATLRYDACGRLTKDETGKTYEYDWLGRMTRAGSRFYTYDGMDRLMTSGSSESKKHVVFDGMYASAERGDDDTGRYLCPGSAACSVQKIKLGGVDRTLFELCGADGTVVASYDATAGTLRHHAYTAFGEHTSEEFGSLTGFHGGYRETETDGLSGESTDRYPLGQGYRWYMPGHRQFNGPDSESPFGVGGLHPYAYCDGDPVNRVDPSGHGAFDWVVGAIKTVYSYTPIGLLQGKIERDGPDWLKKAVRIGEAFAWGAAAIAGAAFTGGTSLVLLGIAVTMATVSAAASVAATLLEDSDPETASIFSWISLGTGLISGALGSAAVGKLASIARNGRRWMRHVARYGPKNASRAMGRTTGGTVRAAGSNAVAPKPMAARLREKLLAPIKEYGAEISLWALTGITGALGNAGVFDNESLEAAVNVTGSQSITAVGLGRGDYFKASYRFSESFAGAAYGKLRLRLRFR